MSRRTQCQCQCTGRWEGDRVHSYGFIKFIKSSVIISAVVPGAGGQVIFQIFYNTMQTCNTNKAFI